MLKLILYNTSLANETEKYNLLLSKYAYIMITTLLLLFLTTANLSAEVVSEQPSNQNNVKKKKANSSPVKVYSDVMQYFGNENKSKFIGNVIAISDEYTLTTDEAEVFVNNANEIVKIICYGAVNFKSADMLAVSKKATLEQLDKIIILEGDAKIWQQENYLEGEYVRIGYESKEIHIDKGDKERVTAIFSSTEDAGL